MRVITFATTWPTRVLRVAARTVARQVVSESGKLNDARTRPLESVTRAGSHWMVSGNSLRTLGCTTCPGFLKSASRVGPRSWVNSILCRPE